MAQQRGSTPTPVLIETWGPDGMTLTPISTANPLPVSSESTPPVSATQATVTVDTTAGGIELKTAAEASLLYVILVNNGATDCYVSLSGTVVSGAAAIANGGLILKSGGGFFIIPSPGPLSIKAITASGSTVVAVTKVT